MKAFLLTAAAFLACAGSMFAQNLPPDYNWEIGANGGYSVMTRPLGTANAYQGNRTNIGLDYSLRLNYFLSPHWMLNLDIGNRKWETYGTWKLNGPYGMSLPSQQVTFLVADNAINESVGINYVIPFYAKFRDFNRANLYFGAQIGLLTTTNDNSVGYSTYKPGSDSAYTYVSHYDYGYGIGYTFGLQMGYTYYIIPRLAVNVDLAIRYANVKTNDYNYGHENTSFYLLYFPETIGVRWRF